LAVRPSRGNQQRSRMGTYGTFRD